MAERNRSVLGRRPSPHYSLIAWLAAYGVVLTRFIPLIRNRSSEASESRSTLLGRIVDSYTNILTVKLFAHAANEDDYARAALEEQTGKHRSYVRLTTVMASILSTLNGLVIAATTAIALWLWTSDLVSVGAIVLVTTLVVRITQMSGWVLNLVTSIFENVGIVQDGMKTISLPQSIVDRPGAKSLVVTKGEIRFDAIGFNYGSAKGTPGADPTRVIDGLSLTIRGGEKIGLIGRSGAGKSTLVNLLLRFYNLRSRLRNVHARMNSLLVSRIRMDARATTHALESAGSSCRAGNASGSP